MSTDTMDRLRQHWYSHCIVQCDKAPLLIAELKSVQYIDDKPAQTLVFSGDKFLVADADIYIDELRSHLPGNTIFSVLQFASYSEPGQQKLLKALEESAPHIHITIIYTSSSVLLPTICSRCRDIGVYSGKKTTKNTTIYPYIGINPDFVLRFSRILSVQNNLPKVWISDLEKFLKKGYKN
jgi:DNA polymerase III, delta subunit